ncbi:MAG: SxtJ family membrane protein [Verrucomicrobiales bacterium]|nr:SxtJ family membrane protein [Verrucomicrobiales bacterium]
MTTIDWNPDESKLRQFGYICLGGFGVISVVVGIRFGHFAAASYAVPGMLWGVGVVAALLAAINAKLLKPLYMVLMAVAAILGPIMSTLALALIFFLVFTPVSLFFKITGRDELKLKLDPRAPSYWVKPPEKPEVERYFRQY